MTPASAGCCCGLAGPVGAGHPEPAAGSGLPGRPGHGVGPPLAAAGQVLAMGDQALVQLAGEHRNAVHPGVVPEPVAGHADLAAMGLKQGAFIEVGPLIDRGFEPGGHGRGSGERGAHNSWSMHTHVLK